MLVFMWVLVGVTFVSVVWAASRERPYRADKALGLLSVLFALSICTLGCFGAFASVPVTQAITALILTLALAGAGRHMGRLLKAF